MLIKNLVTELKALDNVLKSLRVQPIPFVLAKAIIMRNHYLHSIPGGTMLTFGVFLNSQLMGAITFGAGPFNVYSLVEGARPDDCLTLTRLWLSDELPGNSESRVIGIVLRALKQNTQIKFIITYADPSSGHTGIIYRATNWIFTGMSSSTPLYDLGNGKPKHSRSFGHKFGTHSIKYLTSLDISVKLITSQPKFRYLFFLDRFWQPRLKVPMLPYPKAEKPVGNMDSNWSG